ncbi:MAG TPA: hypothetical protein VF070_20545 [Streptosporangiaceae bacterium]
MKLMRVTALGAAVLGLLAVPTTALASPASSPPRPVAVAYPCLPLRLLPPIASSVPAATVMPVKTPRRLPSRRGGNSRRGPKPVERSEALARRETPPVFRVTCAARVLVFDMPAGGRLGTEVRGPRLHVHDAVFYRGRVYTVMAVAGSRFALDYRGKPFVNGRSAIHDGRAVMLGVVSVVICRPAPPKRYK